MSEKRHEINKFANYQNIIVRNFDCHACFCFFSRPLIYGFWHNAHNQYTNPLARPLLIALQVVRTLFGFHLRECMGSSFPPAPPGCLDFIACRRWCTIFSLYLTRSSLIDGCGWIDYEKFRKTKFRNWLLFETVAPFWSRQDNEEWTKIPKRSKS